MYELLSGSSGRLVLRLNFWMRFGVQMLRALRGSNAVPGSGHWVDCISRFGSHAFTFAFGPTLCATQCNIYAFCRIERPERGKFLTSIADCYLEFVYFKNIYIKT
jgi:hypothetical protein